MGLLHLSPELLLCVASYLRHVDLLNVSLTCKHLQIITEPELFREYINPRIHGRSPAPFVRKLIQRPELRKYVQKLDLKPWRTLVDFDPENYMSSLRNPGQREYDSEGFNRHRDPEPTQADYLMFTDAAKAAGVITKVFDFESESYVVAAARKTGLRDVDESQTWYTHAFDPYIPTSDIDYDRKFCQLLRAGSEDPLIVMLVALLPNVREIYLHGVPLDINTLEWRASHGFTALRRLTACASDELSPWPVAFFNKVLEQGRLDVFEAESASSWYIEVGQSEQWEPRAEHVKPLSLRPGSLAIRELDLHNCCLQVSDMKILLQACPQLKGFYYTGGTRETGLYSPSPAKMIELLYPFRDTLQVLSLELDIDEHENWTPMENGLIQSLAHMTALKILDTTPEMWDAVEDTDYELAGLDDTEAVPPADRRLCFRLPPNLEVLMFHLSEVEEMVSLHQLRDLFRKRAQVLPKLERIYIGARDEEYLQDLDDVIVEEGTHLRGGPQPLMVIGGRGHINSIFHRMVKHRALPDLKWFGNKYAVRHRKPGELELIIKKVQEKYDHGYLEEQDMVQLMTSDPELQAVLDKHKHGLKEEVQYESEDADDLMYMERFPERVLNSTEKDFLIGEEYISEEELDSTAEFITDEESISDEEYMYGAGEGHNSE